MVERTGYTAALPAPPPEPEAGAAAAPPADGETAVLRQRLLVSLLLAVPVVVLAMVPAWQFRNWQWLSLTLAAPVAVWGAWPFHRAALVNARHGAATMDTLISAGVTTAILLGRYLEARAKRRSGAALRALAELGAKEAAVLRDGREVRVPVAQLAVGTSSWSGQGTRSRSTAWSPPARPRWTPRCSPASRSRWRSPPGTRSPAGA